MSEKTEQPTPRKLRRAREQGDSPVSSALTQALTFVAVLALMGGVVRASLALFAERLQGALSAPMRSFSAWSVALDVLSLCVPMLGAGALVAAATSGIQAGGSVSFAKLAPDLNRANPFSGLKQLFRPERLLSLVRSLIAALFVAVVAVWVIKANLPSLSNSAGRVEAASVLGFSLAQKLAWLAALVGLALAALDVGVTRYSWLKRHRMTKDEVKREHRDAEGDPELKSARQRAHREALAGSTLLAVRDATVVIVNPTHLATALRYDESIDEAPVILSQGAGDMARKIREAAYAYGVPVVQDVPVARALAELEVGDQIPEALYEAIGAILSEVWQDGTE